MVDMGFGNRGSVDARMAVYGVVHGHLGGQDAAAGVVDQQAPAFLELAVGPAFGEAQELSWWDAELGKVDVWHGTLVTHCTHP